MVGRHHRLDGRECEQAPGAGEGQGSLACGSPRGRSESATAEQVSSRKDPACTQRPEAWLSLSGPGEPREGGLCGAW